MVYLQYVVYTLINFQVMMVTSSSQKIKPSANIPHTIYQIPYKSGFLEDKMIRLQLEGHKLQFFSMLPEALASLCEAALNSTEVFNKLKGFDLIVHDGLAFCGVLISEKLDIPRVQILLAPPNSPRGFLHMIPMPISYVPQLFTGFTDRMTFMERVINLGGYLGGLAMIHLAFGRPMNALKVKYDIKPERSFQEAVGRAEMVIITADFALEFPQPLLPGMWNILGKTYLYTRPIAVTYFAYC